MTTSRPNRKRRVYGRLYIHDDSFWLVSFPSRRVFEDCKRAIQARRLLGGSYHCRLEQMAVKDAKREELVIASQCYHNEPASVLDLIEYLERHWDGTPQRPEYYCMLAFLDAMNSVPRQ